MITRFDFATIVPVLVVTLAACAVLLAESMRRKGESMPHGALGAIGLGGAIVASVLLWDEHHTGFGVIATQPANAVIGERSGLLVGRLTF